jgi:hypothetical protein
VDLRASRDPYDDMTDEALRAELARQTQLLGLAIPTVIDAGTTDAVTNDDANANTGPGPLSEKETTHVDHP